MWETQLGPVSISSVGYYCGAITLKYLARLDSDGNCRTPRDRHCVKCFILPLFIDYRIKILPTSLEWYEIPPIQVVLVLIPKAVHLSKGQMWVWESALSEIVGHLIDVAWSSWISYFSGQKLWNPSMYTYTYLFIYQMLIDHVLCARYFSKH